MTDTYQFFGPVDNSRGLTVESLTVGQATGKIMSSKGLVNAAKHFEKYNTQPGLYLVLVNDQRIQPMEIQDASSNRAVQPVQREHEDSIRGVRPGWSDHRV